jgi:diguanylate cyclase (GGDEF)-like protein
MSQVVDQLAELTGFRDRDVMDVTLVTALRELVQPACVAIYRPVGEEGQQRWLTRARLEEGQAVATADPVWATFDSLPPVASRPHRYECLRTGQFVQTEVDTPQGKRWVHHFPVASGREVRGVIELIRPQALDVAEQRLLSNVLRIYHNFQGLLDYSERDTLTGLLNRKSFDESFLKALGELAATTAQAQEVETDGADRRHSTGRPHHVLGVIDIDHFKSVNDRFGHLIGDEVLLLLSRLMGSSFRFHDLLYRFGGEEFVVLMRCDENDHAGQAFERLRHNTESYAFPQVGRITISVGFTEMRPTDTPASAFERADKAVYYAKSHGRNQVQNFETLVGQGELEEAAAQASDVELF